VAWILKWIKKTLFQSHVLTHDYIIVKGEQSDRVCPALSTLKNGSKAVIRMNDEMISVIFIRMEGSHGKPVFIFRRIGE
jgi:hypothetical protein